MLDTVSAKELDRYAEEDGVLLVDLRSRREYAAGHIRGAVSAPQGNVSGLGLRKDRMLVLYCDRGSLSMAVARDLDAKGYRVKSVVGGFRAYRGSRIVTGYQPE